MLRQPKLAVLQVQVLPRLLVGRPPRLRAQRRSRCPETRLASAAAARAWSRGYRQQRRQRPRLRHSALLAAVAGSVALVVVVFPLLQLDARSALAAPCFACRTWFFSLAAPHRAHHCSLTSLSSLFARPARSFPPYVHTRLRRAHIKRPPGILSSRATRSRSARTASGFDPSNGTTSFLTKRTE